MPSGNIATAVWSGTVNFLEREEFYPVRNQPTIGLSGAGLFVVGLIVVGLSRIEL